MSKKYVIIEKSIALLLIIFAGFGLYVAYMQVDILLTFGRESKLIGPGDSAFFKLVVAHHSQIIPALLELIAGLLLLFNKKAGWLLSVTVCMASAIVFCIIFFKADPPWEEAKEMAFYLVYLGTLFSFLTMLLLLLQKPFLDKYKPSKYSQAIILLLAGIYLTYRYLAQAP